MIDAHPIDQVEQRAEALDPPGVAGPLERVPAVVRIAPQLAGRAEVVRRHAGDDGRTAVCVEAEQLAAGPDVGAVVGDEDGEVAHDGDRSRAAGIADAPPLLEEQELRQLVQPDVPLAATATTARRRRDRAAAMSGSHSVHATCSCAALTAMNSAKSSSQAACAAQKRSNRSRRDGGSRRVEPIEHSRPERLTMRDHSREVDGALGEDDRAAALPAR